MATKNRKVKFLSYDQISEEANRIRNDFKYESIIPVPIEKIIDNDIKINIVPFLNLFKTFEINAITSSDLKTIYIDEYLYINLDQAYRFTIAHELGHIILHREFYESTNIKNLNDWKNFIINVDEEEYHYLELQANNFAGHFLVPQNHLDRHFKAQLKNLIKDSQTKYFSGIKREDYIDLILRIISKKLSSVFEVSSQVIRIRIEKSNMVRQIP